MDTKFDKSLVVQKPKEFLRDLILNFSNAKKDDIIWIQSMLFLSGEDILAIVQAIFKAKTNQAIVYVLLDSYGIITTDDISTDSFLNKSHITSDIKRGNQEKHNLLNELKNSGINFKIGGNKGFLKKNLPWFFCNHRKSYGIINKKTGKHTAWITGINLTDDSFEHFDVAIKTLNQELVDTIYQQFLDDFYNLNQSKNKSYSISNNINYLVVNNALTSNTRKIAYSIINNAEKYIKFITQYPVDPLLLNKLMHKAKLGVDIKILTSQKNDEFNFRKPFRYLNNNFNKAISSNNNISRGYFPGKVHAKLLFSEREALVGSDNLSIITNIAQTKEDMLHILNDKNSTRQLNEIFDEGWDKRTKRD